MERRDFLRLVGITGAGTLTACDQKVGPQKLIPYLVPHEDVTPGIPTWYASTCRGCPAGCGVHVKTREGRVIKLEGNPDSPVNRGKLCATGQTAHQHLYDPDRLEGPRRRQGDAYEETSWEEAIATVTDRLQAASGAGEIVLLGGFQTGTRDRFYDAWAEAIGATRVVWEPFAHEPVLEAHRRVFGRAAIPSYDLAGAEFAISFGADFLETWVSPVRWSREWAAMHAVRGADSDGHGVFVAVEPRLSMTAQNADRWVSVRPGTEHLVALGMANALGAGGPASEWTPARVAEETGVEAGTIEDLAHRFRERRSVALPGGVSTQHRRATAANVAVALLNQAGGAVGDTVHVSSALSAGIEGSHRSIVGLTERMRAGEVSALLVVDGVNPVYALPPALGFGEALGEVDLTVSFGSLFDETAARCELLLPDDTPLESWGDWEPEEGVRSLQQPAMRRVFDTLSTPDVMLRIHRATAAVAGSEEATAVVDTTASAAPAGPLDVESWYDVVRQAWSDVAPDARTWAEVVKAGGAWGVGAAPATVTAAPEPAPGPGALEFGPVAFEGPEGDDTYDLVVYPQIAMYDGRNANRPWLQELADPATTVGWQSWVEVHPATAKRMEVKDGDVVRLESPAGALEVPVIVYPGAREDVLAVPLGRGHTRMGRYAANRGVNPVTILPDATDEATGAFAYQGVRVRMTKTGAWVPPLRHQGSDSQEDRGLARATPIAAALEALEGHGDDHHAEGAHHEPLTVERIARDSSQESPYRWGMSISVDACTGCNACVAACSAENNLPFVGPERLEKSRQMTWLRIERYFEHDDDGTIETRHLPMLCQHCGAAPCEPVCPVYATYHNPEGLNVQVYNRCVGTRYCANNCPYKVRYFNWFSYEWPEPLNWGLNPDVTVREKGVMEKCTYCVQRINAAKSEVRDLGPDAVVPEGFFQTACQQTCPTDAIVFGNLKDPESEVARLASNALSYTVLEELDTRPSNRYLPQIDGRLGET